MATRATSVQITMPQMGESVTEGTVLGWLKQVGDRVEADEPLVEISTDKVDAEVPAPTAGTLVKILAEADETVQVGSVLGEIEPDDGDGAAGGAQAPEREARRAGGARRPGAEPVDVTFPEMGDSVAEGTVLEWRVKVGDSVAVDDPLVEISTDKVDAEVPSPVAGTIAEILVEADQTIPVGSVLCRIAPGTGGSNGSVQPKAEATEAKPAAEASATNGGNVTPVAARIASAHGLDVERHHRLRPAGPGHEGRRSRRRRGQWRAAPERAVEPIRGPAATLVKFMNESRSIPTATSFRTLPVDTLDARRKALKERRQEAVVHAPDRLGDRPGRTRHARHGERLRRAGRQAAARDTRDGQPRPRGRRGAQGRHPLAGRAGVARRRRARVRATSSRATTSWWWARATTRSSQTPTRAPTSRSPIRAASGPSPACPGSCPGRARSSPPAPSATRPA